MLEGTAPRIFAETVERLSDGPHGGLSHCSSRTLHRRREGLPTTNLGPWRASSTRLPGDQKWQLHTSPPISPQIPARKGRLSLPGCDNLIRPGISLSVPIFTKRILRQLKRALHSTMDKLSTPDRDRLPNIAKR